MHERPGFRWEARPDRSPIHKEIITVARPDGLKPNANGTYPVKFNARWGKYFPGEVAAFELETSRKLVSTNVTVNDDLTTIAEPFDPAARKVEAAS